MSNRRAMFLREELRRQFEVVGIEAEYDVRSGDNVLLDVYVGGFPLARVVTGAGRYDGSFPILFSALRDRITGEFRLLVAFTERMLQLRKPAELNVERVRKAWLKYIDEVDWLGQPYFDLIELGIDTSEYFRRPVEADQVG